MDEVFATYMIEGIDFPGPSKARRREHLASPPAETETETEAEAEASLFVAMREAGISKTQLDKRLGVDEKEVRRLLDPHYASKLPRIAHAASVLGQRLVIGLEPV